MKRLLSIVIAILATGAACSGDDTADPTTTPALTAATTAAPTSTDAPSSTTPPPTTVAPTTTSTASTTPPLPTVPLVSYPFPTAPNGQPDWVAILQELLAAATNLSLEPDAERVTTYCLDNSECFEDWQAYIGNLIADDAHAEGLVPDRVLSVEIASSQGDRDPIATGAVVLTAQVEVVGNDDGARVADGNGKTLYLITRDAKPGDINEESYFLGLDASGAWRVVQESTSES